MFHTSLAPLPFAGRLAERLRHWTAGFPRSRRLSRPWPPLRRLGTGLRVLALDGRLSPQSTAMSPGSLGGGQRREATLRRRGFTFCRYPCFPGLALGFVGRP